MNGENHEDHPRIIQARDTKYPKIQENFITEVSEEIEGRVTKNCPSSSVRRKAAFWVPYHN